MESTSFLQFKITEDDKRLIRNIRCYKKTVLRIDFNIFGKSLLKRIVNTFDLDLYDIQETVNELKLYIFSADCWYDKKRNTLFKVN